MLKNRNRTVLPIYVRTAKHAASLVAIGVVMKGEQPLSKLVQRESILRQIERAKIGVGRV